MTRDEWSRVKAIVTGALLHDDASRDAYVASQLGPDASLRGEIDSLLTAAVRAAPLYEQPALLVDGARVTMDALAHAAPDFRGTDRYVIRRRIGSGGMGAVYEVHDCVRGQTVALKTLLRRESADIVRLKREFRSLADIAHPNLVALYDLVVDDEHCFFTMELVSGGTVVDDVRRAADPPDPSHVRSILSQLIEGVRELHRRGKLHRDIKPSNVLVTPEGRVVILDFGLTSNLDGGAGPARRELAGTPAYLSPEQCLGREPGTASDWYAVGATLFHTLVGRPPVVGSALDVIERKTTTDPRLPPEADERVPGDLRDICLGLLHRDPEQRLSGDDALRKLEGSGADTASAHDSRRSPFVGRAYHLEVLNAAFAAVKDGRSASVYVHGPSGIGKSALVQRFLEPRLTDPAVVVLRGRCHEHESVPYKGLDGIVDSLSGYLAALPRAEAVRMMPDDAAALTRLFPVMHLEGPVSTRGLEADIRDPVNLRRKAFAALRQLLSRIAERRALIVEIDDFHWADADSAVTLTELLRPPGAPILLLLVSFRSEEIDDKPFLRALIDRVDVGTKITLPLSPLAPEETDELVGTLLSAVGPSTADRRMEISREAGGNPFLVEQLTRYAGLGAATGVGATLEEMLQRRLDVLPAGSREFLEALAVCGRPIMSARIFEACGLTGDERKLIARLRSALFVRNSRSADHVEMYHDRIRETLAANVPREAARRIHEVVARILVAHGDDDPEALFDHYRGAGHAEAAAAQAALAAQRASAVLAFDRAATFYRHATALHPEAAERTAWTTELARTLENAGRPVEAAESYLAVADRTGNLQRVEWLRKAAEQLLLGGHIDRGLAIIEQVLLAVDMRLARGPRTALGSILMRRTQLAWRGLRFEPRDASGVAREDLLRIDACWSITTGLAMVDNIRAAAFHAQQLLIALDTGEPYRVARALALEAGFSALGGTPAGIRRSEALAERARLMAEEMHNPHVMALVALSAGIGAFVIGKFVKGTEGCYRSLTLLRDECTGVVWEQTLAQNFYLGSLLFRGELRQVIHALPSVLQAAQERGNRYFDTELSIRMNLVWLAMDQADEGERRANEAIGRWTDSSFHRQHYNHLLARVQTALYRGRAEDAWTIVAEQMAPVRRHLWLRVQFFRIETAFMRARAALAMGATGHDRHRMQQTAEASAARIARENMPWSNGLALLVRAAVRYQRGDVTHAITTLRAATDAFTNADMNLYAAIARRRLARLVGGDEGRELERTALAWMAAQEIRNPDGMTRLMAPGYDS